MKRILILNGSPRRNGSTAKLVKAFTEGAESVGNEVKELSGTGSLIVAMILGEAPPKIRYILPAVLLGFVAYGLSIFTYIRAQKTLGAAKTSAFYAVAPFIGAMLSFIFLREALTMAYIIALVILIIGTAFVVSDTLSNKEQL